MTSMPYNTSLHTHGLESGNKLGMPFPISRIHDDRSIEALLALTLLHQKMITAVAFECQLAAPRFPETLLRATVGFHLWHRAAGV